MIAKTQGPSTQPDTVDDTEQRTLTLETELPGPSAERSQQFYGGRYKLRRVIASGAFGTVYEAYDQERGFWVALKVLWRRDSRATYRLKQEFRSLAGIRHRNLVSLYDLVLDGDDRFFTMELIDGVRFTNHVRAQAPQPGARLTPSGRRNESTPRSSAQSTESAQASDAPRIAQGFDEASLRHSLLQLIEGVSCLHSLGKVHRDLKPDNVLVDRDGRVVILDFGLILETSSDDARMSTADMVRGTPAFLAPELVDGAEATASSDWYAVGVTLFEALSGTLPFHGSAIEVLQKKCARPAPPLIPGPGASQSVAQLCSVCERLLVADPKARISGNEVLARLALESSASPIFAADDRREKRELPRFLGRATEMARLKSAHAEVCDGRPIVMCVEGPSGVGKSALIRAFVDETRRSHETVVLRGQCHVNEHLPYPALDGVLDSLGRHLKQLGEFELASVLPRYARELAAIFPVFVQFAHAAPGTLRELPTDPEELRRRASDAINELLRNLSDKSALILHIDDMQWADLDSIRLLGDILASADPPALLLVASMRSETDNGTSSRELRDSFATRGVGVHALSVGPMSIDELQAVVRAQLGDAASSPESALVDRIVREAEGYPSFVREIVNYMKSGTSARGELRREQISLDEAILAVVDKLDGGTRQVLDLIAVAGHPLDESLIAKLVRGEQTPAEHLSLLTAASLVRRSSSSRGDVVEPYHDRIRQTLLRNLEAPRIRALHMDLARAFESEVQPNPHPLALHLLHAGAIEKAAHYAKLAAENAAQSLAFDGAAELYETALTWKGWPADTIFELQCRRADCLAHAGRSAQAAPLYLAAARDTEGPNARALRRRAASNYLLSGAFEQGAQILDRVLSDLRIAAPKRPLWTSIGILIRMIQIKVRTRLARGKPDSELSQAEIEIIDTCAAAGVALGVSEPLRAFYFVATRAYLVGRAGQSTRGIRAKLDLAMALASAGHSYAAWGRELLAQATVAAKRWDDPLLHRHAAAARGIISVCGGRWAEGAAELQRALDSDESKQSRHLDQRAAIQTTLGWALMMHGDLQRLRQHTHERIAQAEDAGDARGHVHATLVRTFVRLADDQPELARREVDAAMARWGDGGFRLEHLVQVYVLAHVDLYCQRPLDALERVETALAIGSRSVVAKVQFIRVMMAHVQGLAAMACAQLDPPRARASLLRATRRLKREATEPARAALTLLQTGAAQAQGREVEPGLFEAAHRFEDAQMRFHAAACRRALALRQPASHSDSPESADNTRDILDIVDIEHWTAIFVPGLN